MSSSLAAKFLALALLLALPASARAQLRYYTNNNAIIISGYNGNAGDLTIPPAINGLPVTGIEGDAFLSSHSLTSITIPDSVTSIGSSAFQNCAVLTNVSIGSGATSIGNEVLVNCTRLTAITVDPLNSAYSSVNGVLFDKDQTTLLQYPGGDTGAYTIPGTVSNVGTEAFFNCASLTGVTIPGSVTNISYWAFNGCSGLTDALIGNGVTSIGYGAFAGCTSLTNVSIGNGVAYIGTNAFSDCSSLVNITIPKNVTNVGIQVLIDCNSLMAITVDPSNSYYSSASGVWFDKGQATLIEYPEGKPGAYTIPNGVTSVAESAFFDCTNLANVTFPSGLASIGSDAFFNCPGLTNVAIGSNVTNIGAGAFLVCYNLAGITVDSLNPAYSSVDGVLFDKTESNLMQYPGGKAGGYTIPGSVTDIVAEAFYDSVNLTSVAIPNSVTAIGNQAFLYCFNLTNATIGSGVTSIGYQAFASCTSLAGITVDALNTTYSSIGGVLFNGTQSILIEYPGGGPGNYTVPVTVTNFGPYAFYDCPRLTGVYCQGNAPGGDAFAINMFLFDNETTVYYLPGTTGWGSTFAFRPTALWLPETQNIAVQANQFGFNVNWASGQVYVVEACTDLANPVWSPIATNTMTNAVSYFSDPQWTNFSARFYRFQLP